MQPSYGGTQNVTPGRTISDQTDRIKEVVLEVVSQLKLETHCSTALEHPIPVNPVSICKVDHCDHNLQDMERRSASIIPSQSIGM